MPQRIILSDVTFDRQEEVALLRVLRSGWVSAGEQVRAFEEEFASYVGADRALAVTNCTAALHLALLALDIGDGDEVIVPSLTFVATVNAVRYTGARPVFADILGIDDLNISPESIEKRITPRTRAVIVMHYGGFPCDMPAILGIARDRGLYTVEDAAHALGTRLEGRHMGTIGHVGCFSFYANKNMTTAEGGMLITGDPEIAMFVERLRSHGMTSLSWDRYQGHAFRYDVVALGYNYRFDELRAAIGRVQLEKLEANNRKRALLYERYLARLADVPRVTVPFLSVDGRLSHHLCAVLLDPGVDRDAVMRDMLGRSVQTSVHYPPVHKMSVHRDLGGGPLPVTEEVARRQLTLPLHPRMSLQDVDHVVDSLIRCL